MPSIGVTARSSHVLLGDLATSYHCILACRPSASPSLLRRAASMTISPSSTSHSGFSNQHVRRPEKPLRSRPRSCLHSAMAVDRPRRSSAAECTPRYIWQGIQLQLRTPTLTLSLTLCCIQQRPPTSVVKDKLVRDLGFNCPAAAPWAHYHTAAYNVHLWESEKVSTPQGSSAEDVVHGIPRCRAVKVHGLQDRSHLWQTRCTLPTWGLHPCHTQPAM